MSQRVSSTFVMSCFAINCIHAAMAASFQPIALKPQSYNQDVIVEKSAPPPVLAVTTSCMETGPQNTGYTWFEQGYLSQWPSAGLPPAGSTFLSPQDADHSYRMAASYRANNAILIDAEQLSAGIIFVKPSSYTGLSFLTSSGMASSLIGYTLHHQDGGSQTGTFTSPNWYSLLPAAWVANGRVNATSFVLFDINNDNPKLYSVDIAVTNTTSPVTGAELFFTNGSGHAVIFAISGRSPMANSFDPVEIAGFNQDVVVEANAPKPGFLQSNTTATMETGTSNLRFTWYEQGYNPLQPQSGLPCPASVIGSEADAGYRFAMAPDYSKPNAVLLDALCTNAVLSLVAPTNFSAISFLTAAGQGSVTNRCVFFHLDGSKETNRFVSPNWLSNLPGVFVAHGRVSVSTRLFDGEISEYPRLFAVDVPLTNTQSPLSRIVLSTESCPADPHAVVFAVSGVISGGVSTARPVLSVQRNVDGTLRVGSSKPGRLESCAALGSANTSWKSEGNISSNLSLTVSGSSRTVFYRVVVPGN